MIIVNNMLKGVDNMRISKIYYEPNIEDYYLGRYLLEKYSDIQKIPIDNHNNIESLRKSSNKDFRTLKTYLIIGTRKTHKYTPNHKSSDYLVPFTSSGCGAMCLYCYLVCNYNKCSYLRVFVNREEMMFKLIKKSLKTISPSIFEIGSNSDLVLENTITSNLPWAIESFAESGRGFITFPTKFSMVDPLLNLNHKGKTIIRMSVNPQEIISNIEIGTSSLLNRIKAVNKLCDAGYKIGLLIAPVIMVDNWKKLYVELLDILNDKLSSKAKNDMFIEVIFMTYSFIHRAINHDAFPHVEDLYSRDLMTARGRGKYAYKKELRQEGEIFLRNEIEKRFSESKILYIV